MYLRWIVALSIACSTATAAKAQCVLQTLALEGVQRSYTLCAPPDSKPNPPVLLLLHGSGSNGAAIASLWQAFAERNGIILVAPDALRNDAWRLKDDSPDVLHAIVNEVQAKFGADRRRLYLFGQSGGAVYALTLAMLESRYFAGVAIHAGAWRTPPEFRALALAQRKIPIKIIIGDRDEYFSMAAVRRTGEALKEAGFPSEIEIVPGQHHGFIPEIAAATEQSAWAWLSPLSLPTDPVFLKY